MSPLPGAVPGLLVVGGPNRLTRNPMHAGTAGLLLAVAVYRLSGSAVVPMLGSLCWVDRAQIRPEETQLLQVFDEGYAVYCRQVPAGRVACRGDSPRLCS